MPCQYHKAATIALDYLTLDFPCKKKINFLVCSEDCFPIFLLHKLNALPTCYEAIVEQIEGVSCKKPMVVYKI